MGFTTVTFCAALLVLANAGPVYKLAATEESACSLTCSDTNKFDYQPGSVYEFSYDGKTTTKMNGASEDSAIIQMNAKVEIEPITKCDLVMRIKDASLRDSEDQQNSQAFKEAMMEHALKFSFQDGRIDHICSTEGESIWTLNIKRGILSAFQNSMDSFDRNQNLTETDVVGTCRSEYKVISSGRRNERVEKTKNLLSCSDREGYRLAIQSIGYNVPSFVKSLPLMKSEYKCTQTLDLGSNILQSSTCSEEHVFRPFSYEQNGAMTSSEQTLTFTNKRRAGSPSREIFNQRSTLLFHHQDDIPSKQDKEDKIEAKLQELCQKAVEDIRPEVPEMVNQLIEHMRHVDRDVLSRVYKKINQRTICAPNADRIKQYFHDAIPMVGTEASVGMIQDLISKKRVIGNEAEMWLLSLSFVHHPTKEMIAAATPLLDERDVSGNTLLAVSSLASSYCNARPDCGKDSEITTLLRKLMDHTHDCNTQNGDVRKIIFALRAIGNIGHSREAVSHLTRCFTRRDVREEIRIAAMDAFRRIPCDAMRSDLMGVFRDESEDSELRLNAYIALMKCPSRNVFSEVRQVLEKEKSNQVGSFVWSHLTNLMETSDPHMQDIRNIVQDEELKKEFNLDQRKFSRNYEGSFFLDSINMGAKVDSNVIFSQKSFIPRSANLNLTIDLFGHAINFLEFGGRVQGAEKILENFFGPSGTNTPTLKTRVPINFDKSMDAFRASAYLRVFGNELRYWDDKSLNELQSSLRRLMHMQSLSFSKTMTLLDSRMVIPTCVGLPLNLTISTTGSISLDAKAEFQRPNFDLNIHFRPSASIQVKGEMSVDAHVSRAGLKMVTVAHTSTGAKLDISNNKFDLQIPQKKMEIFNLKTDFYIVHRNGEQRQKMIVDNVKKHEICTGKFMKQVTGLTFCQNLKFPNASRHKEAPFFPFTGPVVYDLYMINEDAPNGYQIEGFTKQSPYSFYMDTPNSKVSRRIAIDTVMKNKNEAHITFKAPWKNIKIEGTVVNMVEMKKLTGTVSFNDRTDYALNAEVGMKNTKGLLSFTPKFDITIPQKRMKYEGRIEVKPMKSLLIDMSATGFIANDINLKVSGEIIPKEMGLTGQFRIGKKEYYIASRLGRLVSKSGFKLTPSLKITIPNRDLVEFTSEILYESKKKMSFDFQLNKVFPKTIAMNAVVLLNAGKTKTKNIVKILFKSPRGNFRINGDVDNKKTGITSRVIGSYNFGAKYSDRLTLSSKIRDLSVKSVRYMGNIALASKKREFLNFNLKGQLAKANNHLETKFDLRYGNPKVKTNNLKFACVLNRALKQYSHAYDYTMLIQHPGKKINYKVEANHVQSAKRPFKKFENKVMIQMAPGKVVQTSLSYINAKEKGLPTYESEMALSYPGRAMRIADKLMQVNRNTYENNFSVQWQKGKEAMVKSTYTRTGKDIHNVENTLILPNNKEVKATAMVQATSGAYKAKVHFDAEENSIYNEQMLYTAEARMTNKYNGRQNSTDASIDITWSPTKRLSANMSSVYTNASLTNKLAFSTPFSRLKFFEYEAKSNLNSKKYSGLTKISWNKKNEFRQYFSISLPGEELDMNYLTSLDRNGKESSVKITAEKIDKKVTGSVKLTIDNTPKFYIEMSHLKDKKQRKIEGMLNFDILGTSADIKTTHTTYLPNGEISSTGEGNIKLPFQNFKGIKTSYRLEHNSQLSSIDLVYSSSLANFKNGHLLLEARRNLAKILKYKIQLTKMKKEIFNLEAKYQRNGDYFNIDIDLVNPQGQKITTSAYVSLLGRRKTSSLEIKGKHIDVSAKCEFEFQNRRFIDGEVKISAKTKNLKMSANYKKDDANHELDGSLELPDGRSIDGKIGLILKDAISLSLLVNSPDFPSLTNIDINILFNGDFLSSVTKGYIKVLPYLKESEFEASVDVADNVDLAFVLKTPFGNMRNVKATLSLQNNLSNAMKIKSEFELNKNKVIDLEFGYKVKSIEDFSVSFDLKTSHRRLNVVSLLFKHSGDFYNMESILKARVGQEVKINGKLSNLPSYNEILLKAEFKDLEDFEVSFKRFGYLNDMQATVFYMLDGKEQFRSKLFVKEYGAVINAMMKIPDILDFEFESELDIENISFNLRSNLELRQEEIYKIVATYEHLAKLYIDISFPSYNDELTMTLNGDLKMFNALAKLKHNSSKYELTISNQGYYRKIDAQLVTPFFKEMASFIFNGDEETFNAQAKIMHDNDQYELVVSNRNHYRQMTIALSTPFSTDKFDIDFDGDLPSFKCLLIFSHNNIEYKLQVSNDNYYRKLNAELTFPAIDIKASFSLEGDLQSFNMITELIYNEKTFRLDVSNKDYYKEMAIKLLAPFTKDSLSFSLDGTLSSFNAKLKYMHFKSLYELVVFNSGFYREIEVKLSTPYFRDMLSISVDGKLSDFDVQAKIMHNHKNYQLSIVRSRNYRKLGVELTTPFYEGSLEFSLKGNLQSFQMTTKVMHNNEKFQLTVSTLNYYRQVNADLTTPYFKESVDFLFNGTLRRFDSHLTFRHNKIIYEIKASNREFYREMNLQLTTPFVSCDFQFEGSLQIANVDFQLNIGKWKYECNISTRKYFQISEIMLKIPKHTLVIKSNIYYKRKSITGDITTTLDGKKFILTGMYKDTGRKKIVKADLKTPYFEDSLHASIAGTLRKFNANLKLQHDKDIYEMVASNKNYYAEMDVSLKAPGMKAKFQSEGDLQKCEVSASLKMATNLYELTLSNQNYLRNINIETSTPQTGKCTFNFGLQGNRNHFDVASKFSLRNKKYELNISGNSQIGEYEMKVLAPQIHFNGHFNGDLKSFSFNANVVFKKEKYEVMASTKNYFRDISGKLITPQFGEQSLSVKINGQLKDFNSFIEVQHNKELYRSEFSLANQEFRLSLPKLLEKLQVKLNGNWKNFEFIMQIMDYDGERIEIKASNKNFKEMKAHLAIPRMENIDVLIKTSGDIRNGESTMKMAYGENVFENKVEMNFDGSQASFEIEPHYKILGRSGKAKLQIDLMFEDQSYKYELEADVEGVQFKSMGSVKISSEISVLMTVNLPTFDESEMKLRLVSEGFRKTDMMLNMKSPWTGMTKIFYEHNGQRGNSFVTKGYMERDGVRLTSYSLDSYFADNYSFDFKCDYDNFKNKIETTGDLKFQGRKTIASLSLRTPFQILKECLISAETKILRDSVKADVGVKLPNQEYSMNIDVDSSSFNALLNVNMDNRRKDRQYQFQTSYKNTDRRADVSRSFNFKMVLPERTVSLDCRFENNQNSILASAQVLTEVDKSKNFGVEFQFDKGNKNTFTCKLNTPRRNIELFGSFAAKGNQNTLTGYVMLDADRSQQKIETKMDVFSYSNKKNIDFLLKFPNQKNGMRIKTFLTGPEGDRVFSGKTELSIDQDPAKTVNIDVNLMALHQNYTLNISVTHPDTNLLAHMSTFVANASDRFTTGMDLAFTTVNNERHNVNIRGEILKMKREFNFKMQAPSQRIEVIGFMKTANRFVMSVKKTETGKEDMEAAFIVDPNVNSIHMDLSYDQENPSKVYRLDAAANVDKVMLKAYRMEGRSRRGTDTRFIAELRPSHVLYLSLRWNPNILKDLNKFLYEKLRQFGAEVKTIGLEVSESISVEFLRRLKLTQKSLMTDFQPVLKYFEMEHESLYRDISRYVRNFNELYKKNNFYLKTLSDYLSHVWSSMWLEYKIMAYNLQVKLDEFSEFLSKKLDQSTEYFDMIYGKANTELRQKMSNVYNSLKEYAGQVQDYYLSMFHAFLYTIKTDVIDFVQNVPEFLKVFIDDMKHNPFVTRMIVLWSEINDSIAKKQSQLNQKMNDLTSTMTSVQDTVSRHLDSIRYIPAMDALLEILNDAYQQLAWAYRYWNVKSNVNNLRDIIKDMFFSKLNQLKTSFTDLDMNTLVFAPKRGEIVVEIKYGAAIHVYHLVDSIMNMAKEMQLMVQKYQKMLPKGNTTIWDFYYMMKPSSQIPEWMPPFKAHASLFGGQHITTFDGRHFDYKGTCSYLMARDFVDGKFTVLANYDPDRSQRTIKSITVITARNEEVEIFSDYKVKLRGQYTDLPIELKHSFVMREGDLIILKSLRGYQVTADLRLGLYTLDISGWYFSKVAGMFGTYNYEPSDDMTMYNMARTDNIEEFATSWWTASSVCKSHRNFAPTHRIPDSQECHKYFVNNNSPFRNCFRQVKPDVYYHMCNSLRSSAYSTISDVCDVSAVYMGECRRKEVDLQMPQSCVSCTSIMGNRFFQKQDMVLKSSRVPAAADIILVVEERICNKMVGSRLPDIVKHIKSILEQKGLQDNRFGLIGFGGSRKEPNYIHTMDGQMISSSDLMIRSLENITFPNLPANVDVMKAVMRAAEYPFRGGVRKAVILVTCTGCHETDVTTWELAQMLEKFDITLHVLADHDFKTKGNLSSKTTYLYGADKSHAYSEGIVDAEMETNIVVPEDNCVQLGLESNGSYFDSKKLEKETANISFMERFAERISESLMPTSCQRCDCVSNERGLGQSICKSCSKTTNNLPMNYLSVESH